MVHRLLPHTTHLDIEALVDGQLPPEKARHVTDDLLLNPRLFSFYQELMAQKELLRLWWSHEKQKLPVS